MADVSVTATSVAKTATTRIINGFLGGTVTAGQPVYQATDGTYLAADANASATTSTCAGVALNGGASGQPVAIAAGGTYTPGFTVTVGAVYVVSATAGGIAPVADLATGWYTSILCVGITVSTVQLVLVNSGVAVP